MSEATAIAAEAGCVFCKLVMTAVTTGTGIEQLGSSGVYHFEPLNPVTPGHRLFVPAFHYEDAANAPSATGSVFEWAAWWAASCGEDFNLIVNAGPAASQTVRHLHVHYVPRRDGDGLILPWTSLAAHDAEVRASVLAEQGEPEWEYGVTSKWGIHEHPTRDGAERWASDIRWRIAEGKESGDLAFHGIIMHRTRAVAGPWLPVEENKPESTDGSER